MVMMIIVLITNDDKLPIAQVANSRSYPPFLTTRGIALINNMRLATILPTVCTHQKLDAGKLHRPVIICLVKYTEHFSRGQKQNVRIFGKETIITINYNLAFTLIQTLRSEAICHLQIPPGPSLGKSRTYGIKSKLRIFPFTQVLPPDQLNFSLIY